MWPFHPGSQNQTGVRRTGAAESVHSPRQSSSALFCPPPSPFFKRATGGRRLCWVPPVPPSEPAPVSSAAPSIQSQLLVLLLKGLPHHSLDLLPELCGLNDHQGSRREANFPPSRVLLHMLDIDKSRQRPGSTLEVLSVFEGISVIFIHFQKVERKHFGFSRSNVFLLSG